MRGYLEIRRTWSPGDIVTLQLPMPVTRLYAHPSVKADIGRVALKRGPLVYCLEGIDNGNAPVSLIRLPKNAQLDATERRDLFDGIITVIADARSADPDAWNGALYTSRQPELTLRTMTAVPYFLWSNRGPNPMTVWIPES
jgi:DUF1680 family protein